MMIIRAAFNFAFSLACTVLKSALVGGVLEFADALITGAAEGEECHIYIPLLLHADTHDASTPGICRMS